MASRVFNWRTPKNLSTEKQDALFEAWNWMGTEAKFAEHLDHRRLFAQKCRKLVHAFGVRYPDAPRFRAPFRAGLERGDS